MLSDQNVIEILNGWSFWEAPPQTGLARHTNLPKNLRHSHEYL